MERTVERLLGELLEQDVRIIGRTELGNSELAPVARLTLDREYDGIGRTVIAKSRRPIGGEWGALANEQLALEHLRASGLAPRFLTGVPDQLVVMTDLGAGPTVQDLLFGNDPQAATNGLLAMAKLAGKLHGATNPSFAAAHQGTFLDRALDNWPGIVTAAADFGCPPPDDVELTELARDLRELTAFTHGDFTPNNVVLVDGEARLVDFEGAGRRHPGLDAACLRLPFPQYGHWAVLPPAVIDEMDDAYRETLSGCDYTRLIATGCATWAIIRLARLPLIASTQTPADALRRRTQIVQTITSAAASSPTYPTLSAWFETLADAMRHRWDEARQPPRTFQAFKDFSNQ
ncbi:phosphotransferase family protein [Kribbella kalugense]|uniref:Phosphotransferase family enzyme n=1 Tax=Kribbella kalugense TaxID=2512221 RepID=A0A4R7ZJ61_9ACTN|nr:phosphotransferase [Kribbella kalugense]TDW17793.1 phosphotransferase family enzyme [Kribbella kalugense]